MLTKYVVSTKFVKRLEKTEFYEMRVSVGNNEYRTVLFAIDADNFMECHRMVMLNSFVEKGTKQYPAEIKKAERLLKEWEDSLGIGLMTGFLMDLQKTLWAYNRIYYDKDNNYNRPAKRCYFARPKKFKTIE